MPSHLFYSDYLPIDPQAHSIHNYQKCDDSLSDQKESRLPSIEC